jgi:myo-inositol catabolism protein IolS
MDALVDSGQVRYIGVSNFSVKELEEARSVTTRHPIVSNQVLYNLKRREIEKDLLPYCQQNRITIIAYTPLADGSLAAQSPSQQGQRKGPLHRAAERLLGGERARQGLQEVANKVGKTPAQVALNWCISHPDVITIPKANSLARIEENCGASGWCLSGDQLRQLDEAFPA